MAHAPPATTITTLGFLHGGPPAGAHLVLDLRHHFRDPHVNPQMREMTARDAEVRAAVLATPGIHALVAAAEDAVLAFLAGPSAGPLHIAVGCAGGRHRAATVGGQLAAILDETHRLDVELVHRDLDRPVRGRTAEGCVFCEIATGDRPAHVVARWDDAVVIVPVDPVADGHLLVLPVVHTPHAAADPHIAGAVMARAAELAARRGGDCNLITSRGAAATQTIEHLHVHLVPRAAGDGLALPWNGGDR